MTINYLTLLVSFIMLLMLYGTSSLVWAAETSGQASAKRIITALKTNYSGSWITADGYIQLELSADGRYIETRGNKENAFTGHYEIHGKHIRYHDDKGFNGSGDFGKPGILYHSGHVFYKQ